MDALLDIVRRAARLSAWVCGGLMLGAAIAITVDVVIRKLFGLTLAGGALSELSGYVLAVSAAWGAGWALLDRAHVRIDTLQMLAGPRLRAGLDLLALVSFAAAFGLLAAKAWGVFLRSWELGSRSMTPLATPMAAPQLAWALGWSFVVLCALLLIAATLQALLRGDRATAHRLAGARTVAEESAAAASGPAAGEPAR